MRPFQHFGLKAWSVALAVMLWMIVSGEQTVERGLRVPLELQQFPAGLELRADAPSLIDVRVRGSSGTLSRIGPGDLVGVLDLRTARAGRRLFQMTPEQIRGPFGVEIVQVSPQSIALTFENTAIRLVPVVPAIEGNPAPGFIVGKTTSQPSTVEVVGPESAVERVTEATTEPLSVDAVSSSVTEMVTVGFLDPSLRLRVPKPARVTVDVVPGPIERTLDGRAVRPHAMPKGLAATLTPPQVDVVLRGGTQKLNRVDSSAIVPWVDLTGLGPGEYVLAVHVDPPPEAGLARVIPATVQVRLTTIK